MPRKGIQRCACGHGAFWLVRHTETSSIVACKRCLKETRTTSRARHTLDEIRPPRFQAAGDQWHAAYPELKTALAAKEV